MNGLALEPDHGFPVRLIVPGQIGGRMVKWLTRIEVSATESSHHVSLFSHPEGHLMAHKTDTAALLGSVVMLIGSR